MLIVVSASEHLHVCEGDLVSSQQSCRQAAAPLQHCRQGQCPAAMSGTCSHQHLQHGDGWSAAGCRGCMCRVMYCPCSHCSAAAAGGRGGPGTGRGHECCSQHSCGLPTFCSTRSGVQTLGMETSVSFRVPKFFY